MRNIKLKILLSIVCYFLMPQLSIAAEAAVRYFVKIVPTQELLKVANINQINNEILNGTGIFYGGEWEKG